MMDSVITMEGNMTVGFGVVGSGMMGRIYVRALRHMVEGADVVAIHGGSRVTDLAAEVDVPVEPTLDALLERPDVDAILLASPTQTHLAQTMAAAEAGKHVFTEKPIAATLGEIDQMVDATRAAGVLLGVKTVTRYRTGYRLGKKVIGEGGVGEDRRGPAP